MRTQGLAAVVIALLAAGNTAAAPLIHNQNQYLLPVVGDRSDWLAGQGDPYPVFTSLASVFYELGGYTGLRVAAFLFTAVALWGVYLVARSLSDSEPVQIVATVLVGLTLLPVGQGSGQEYLSAFHGLAGQYVMWKPAYLQPSAAGCIVLLAFGLWLWNRVWWAAALTVVAGLIHPTYVVVAGVGLVAAAVADLVGGRGWRRLPGYAATVVVAFALTSVFNPDVSGLAGSTGAEEMRAFAFERIPHHTLWTSWRTHDLVLLALIVMGIVVARPLQQGRWLAVWMGAVTVISLGSAAVVEWTRWTALALLFPWRITAILVPVAATVVAVRLGMLLAGLRVRHWRVVVVAVAGAAAVWGLASTLREERPTVSDPAVRAVLAAQPTGTGLVPLNADNVRANARVAVYVDWKSPPYTADGLATWWERVDQVAAFERDPETFCSGDWAGDIDWALLTVAPPSCMREWAVLAEDGGYRVVQR